MSLRLFLASALSLALLTPALAGDEPVATTPAPATVAPDVKIGDEWDYHYHSNIGDHATGMQSYVVEDVGGGKIETKLRTQGANDSRDQVVVISYDLSWRVMDGPKGKVIKLEGGGQPFPAVSVGKEWNAETWFQPLNSNLSFKWIEHGHVSAWEPVKLADGKTYDAFKITYRRESASMDGSGFQILKAGMTTQKLVERTVEWYAPAINRYVKRTFEASRDGTIFQDFSEELTKYTRGD